MVTNLDLISQPVLMVHLFGMCRPYMQALDVYVPEVRTCGVTQNNELYNMQTKQTSTKIIQKIYYNKNRTVSCAIVIVGSSHNIG